MFRRFSNPLFDKLDDISYYREKWGDWRGRTNIKAAVGGFILVGALIVTIVSKRQVEDTWKKVDINTPFYADTAWLKNKDDSYSFTYRLIRPVNATEINAMKIPDWEKQKLINELDTSAEFNKPVMIYSALTFQKDSIYKYQTALLGTCTKKDSVTAPMQTDSLKTLPQKWFGLKPNMKLAKLDNSFKLPEHYVYADDLYYIEPLNINLGGEPQMFNNTKKSKL